MFRSVEQSSPPRSKESVSSVLSSARSCLYIPVSRFLVTIPLTSLYFYGRWIQEMRFNVQRIQGFNYGSSLKVNGVLNLFWFPQRTAKKTLIRAVTFVASKIQPSVLRAKSFVFSLNLADQLSMFDNTIGEHSDRDLKVCTTMITRSVYSGFLHCST